MIIYLSYWSKPNQDIFLPMWKITTALVIKHYKNIEVITDSEGYEALKDLPFSKIHICLNNLPDYTKLWSIGKIYAYQKACEIGEPFLHLDADVFLWEPLPDKLLNSSVFCQSSDYFKIGQNVYDTTSLETITNLSVPQIWKDHIGLQAYNMGIFGGTNLSLINNYCIEVINMINDSRYTNLWKFNSNYNSLTTKVSTSNSTLLEQGNFTIFCKKNHITPNTLFPNIYDHKNYTYKKYTHLMALKYKPKTIQRIIERVSTDPYNLSPADIPIEQW